MDSWRLLDLVTTLGIVSQPSTKAKNSSQCQRDADMRPNQALIHGLRKTWYDPFRKALGIASQGSVPGPGAPADDVAAAAAAAAAAPAKVRAAANASAKAASAVVDTTTGQVQGREGGRERGREGGREVGQGMADTFLSCRFFGLT